MKSEISERAAGSEQAPLHAPWFKEAVRVSNLYLAKDAASPAKKHEDSFLQCMGKLPQKVQGHYLQLRHFKGDWSDWYGMVEEMEIQPVLGEEEMETETEVEEEDLDPFAWWAFKPGSRREEWAS